MLKLKHSYFDLSSLIALACQSIGIIEKNHYSGTQDTKIPSLEILKELMDKVREEVTLSQKVLKVSSKEKLTEEVYRRDALRDENFKGFRDAVGGMLRRHRSQKYQATALYLDDLLERYGKTLHRLPLNDQSTVMKAFFDEIKGNEQGMELLKGTIFDVWLNEMIQDQEEFDKVYQQRLEETVINDLPTQQQVFTNLRYALEHVFSLLTTFVSIGQLKGLDTTYDQLIVLIAKLENKK